MFEKLRLKQTAKSVNSIKVREFNGLISNYKQACNVFSQSLTQFDQTVKGI